MRRLKQIKVEWASEARSKALGSPSGGQLGGIRAPKSKAQEILVGGGGVAGNVILGKCECCNGQITLAWILLEN